MAMATPGRWPVFCLICSVTSWRSKRVRPQLRWGGKEKEDMSGRRYDSDRHTDRQTDTQTDTQTDRQKKGEIIWSTRGPGLVRWWEIWWNETGGGQVSQSVSQFSQPVSHLGHETKSVLVDRMRLPCNRLNDVWRSSSKGNPCAPTITPSPNPSTSRDPASAPQRRINSSLSLRVWKAKECTTGSWLGK